MATKKASEPTSNDIIRIDFDEATFYLLGKTPLISNRMSTKARQELLAPKGKMNAAEKAMNQKHNPMAEFAASPYILRDTSAPTHLGALSVWFKKAMMTAALDMPGTKMAQMGRLLRVEGERLPLYGIPQLLMAVTRSADMNRTPDIRTRAIVPEWAVEITVTYPSQLIKGQMVANLLHAAGLICGVGDWRQQKGSGDYGLFEIVSPDHDDYQRIVAQGGRDAQIAAMAAPECYDDETAELLSWFDNEMSTRKLRGVA